MSLKGLDNFSTPIQSALTNDGYHGGAMTDISVTGLIDSARIKKLRSKHFEDISEHASRRIASLLGTAFHKLMEEHSPEESFEGKVELTFYEVLTGQEIVFQ